MDLGLKGKTAIVCGSSGGIGKACAIVLAQEGASVIINGRTPDRLEEAAAEIRALAPEVSIITVAGSVTNPEVRQALVSAAPQIDILVNNAGGPPPGNFRDWDRDTWIAAVDQNMLSAIELIRLTADGMAARGFGRIINVTSSAVRVPIPFIGLSNATRAGLTNFVFGLAAEFSGRGVTINNLLPGPFDTERLRQTGGATGNANRNPVAGRVGDPMEMGAMCAFLCSKHAGYITGQNFLMDGGLCTTGV